MLTEDQFVNFFNYYKGLTCQEEAVKRLYKDLPKEILDEKSQWIEIYRSSKKILLNVPWYPQIDNYTMPYRTCNSSSCAMALKYFMSNSLSDKLTADDEYLKVVQKYGDTTVHEVQTKALRAYGLNSVFKFNLGFKDIDKELEEKKPVVIAIKHRGPLDKPTGGHIIICTGRDRLCTGYYFNDPYGSCNTNYSTKVEDGYNVFYSKSLLEKRWLFNGPNTGWGRLFNY